MEKKYVLVEVEGSKFKQLRANRDFGGIKKGDFGGLVDSEDCLSQEGNCWVFEGGIVYHGAKVSGNAEVHGLVFDKYTCIRGDAIIMGKSVVCMGAVVEGDAVVENAWIGEYGHITNTNDYITLDNDTAYKLSEHYPYASSQVYATFRCHAMDSNKRPIFNKFFGITEDPALQEKKFMSAFARSTKEKEYIADLVNSCSEEKLKLATDYLKSLAEYED